MTNEYEPLNESVKKSVHSQIGSLTVHVQSGYGIYPLADATVKVYAEDPGKGNVVSVTKTDNAGNTPKILLDVRGDNDRGEYLPGGQLFTIEVNKDGYQSVIYRGVQLYPLIETLLTVNLPSLPDRPGKRLTRYDGELVY